MQPKSIAETLYSLQLAIDNCERSNNREWLARHRESMSALCKLLPSGSGIDRGTRLIRVRSTAGAELIEFECSFHHMSEHGYYDGWTDHMIRVRPSFSGIDIMIGGRDRNGIKEVLREIYHHALTTRVRWDLQKECWISEYENAPAVVNVDEHAPKTEYQ